MTYELSVRIDESYNISESVVADAPYLAIRAVRQDLKRRLGKFTKIWIYDMKKT